jgi:hypothetical protein
VTGVDVTGAIVLGGDIVGKAGGGVVGKRVGAVPVNIQLNCHPVYDVDGVYDVLTDHVIVIDPVSATNVLLDPYEPVNVDIKGATAEGPSYNVKREYDPVLDTEYRENVI